MSPSESDKRTPALGSALAAGATIALAIALGTSLWGSAPTVGCYPQAVAPPASRSPIQHLFIIIKENHAFENYFGTLPGVFGNPPNATLPTNLSGSASIHPFPLGGSSTPDLPHDRAADLVDYNGGLNNLFVAEAAARGYVGASDAAGYYTETQIPGYFAYARSYALGDQFFSGVLGPTLPNRIFDLAATNGNWTSDDPPPPSSVDFPTILNQLSSAGVPWYYDYTGSAQKLTPLLLPRVAADPCMVGRIQPISALTSQLAASAPASVTFIDASHDRATSEHPPANVTYGEEWTVSVVNAIARSPVGPASAVVLLWDENGGFWDPVPPPVRPGQGDGFRVPFLVLSPWTPAGRIVHDVLDPASILRFVDDNWGQSYLNDRVANAASLRAFFDFQNGSRPWVQIPTPIMLAAQESPTPHLLPNSGEILQARLDRERTADRRHLKRPNRPSDQRWVFCRTQF